MRGRFVVRVRYGDGVGHKGGRGATGREDDITIVQEIIVR